LGQLKSCFPSDQGQTLLANCTRIFFGTTELQTAEFISKSCGNETIIVESGGHNSGWSRNRGSSSGSGYSESSGSSTSGGSSNNWQQQTRELLKPEEIIALDPRIAITLTAGVRPIWTRLVRYYEDKSLFKRRGFLARLAAAVWTLFLSAALLASASAAARALTSEFHDAFGQQQQPMPPATYQPQPWLTPR